MFRHVALFRWVPGATTEKVRAVQEGLAALPAVIAEVRAYHTGADAGLAGGNWDYAVVADFDDADGWRAYTDHPAHRRVGAELVGPLLAERAAVQYDC